MDKEENVFKISEFISKSLSDCLEEGELQELEKWLAEDERHRELFDQWSSTELMEHKVGEYERLDYMKAWEEFRTVRRDKLSAKRRKIRRTWMRYAAMFMIPLGVAVALLSRDDIKEKRDYAIVVSLFFVLFFPFILPKPYFLRTCSMSIHLDLVWSWYGLDTEKVWSGLEIVLFHFILSFTKSSIKSIVFSIPSMEESMHR